MSDQDDFKHDQRARAGSNQDDKLDPHRLAKDRIDFLFRACQRESKVHPLKDLLIRYKTGQAR